MGNTHPIRIQNTLILIRINSIVMRNLNIYFSKLAVNRFVKIIFYIFNTFKESHFFNYTIAKYVNYFRLIFV